MCGIEVEVGRGEGLRNESKVARRRLGLQFNYVGFNYVGAIEFLSSEGGRRERGENEFVMEEISLVLKFPPVALQCKRQMMRVSLGWELTGSFLCR